jgi:acetylornithine/succinyldiaminopimelate/putrescine aminotransferase
VQPDLVVLAKGLANGLPIGALLVADEVAGAFAPGHHGSTFGGNAVSCAAACAVVDALDDDLLANVQAQGKRLRAGLKTLAGLADVRGAGLLLGADTERPAAELAAAALEHGLVVLTAGEHVLRLAPPLVVGPDEVDDALAILEEVLA